ncbi:MAG: ankyrin repeat domain-containing protein [Bacteroidetes bacterium]|nr:MAG: ankyrin repeat domain-containing protein [Bacteroidota bacterium]
MNYKKIVFLLLKITFSLILFLTISCNNGNSQSQKDKAQIDKSDQEKPVMDVKSFHDAAYNGDLAKVKSAIESGIQADVVDKDGQNALMLAAFNGHTEIVKLLIENKVSVNTKATTGRTALMYASSGPFPQTVQLLIENNAAIDIVDNVEHFTAFMFAASEGQLEVVKILLKVGADAKLKDIDGDNAETFARKNGHVTVADFIKNNSSK